MISPNLNTTQSVWNSLIPFWQTIWINFLWQNIWKVLYTVQHQRREYRYLLMKCQRLLYFLAEWIPELIHMQFYHRAKYRSKYADGCYNSIIDDKDRHVPSPLIMSTCSALRHAILDWQKNKSVPPKSSKSKLKAERPSASNSSGPSLWIQVRVETKALPQWRSGVSINPNCQLGHGSMVNSQRVWIGQDISGLPSRSIYRFIWGFCICSLLIVSYQNRIFSNK